MMKMLKVSKTVNTEKELAYFSKGLSLKLYKEQLPPDHHINGPANCG